MMISVEELLALLHDLPIEALKKPIFVTINEEDTLMEDITIEPVMMDSHSSEEIVGYVIVVSSHDESQMKFDFDSLDKDKHN
jgi:hypothetical protein